MINKQLQDTRKPHGTNLEIPWAQPIKMTSHDVFACRHNTIIDWWYIWLAVNKELTVTYEVIRQ